MRAGFSSKDITPGISMPMAGFDRRTAFSDGILDELHVSVLALEDEKESRFLFCVFDLLGTDRILCAQVKNAICQTLGIAEEHIWVCATHSHSAPSGHFWGKDSYQKEYADHLVCQAAAAAGEALQDLAAVQAEVGVSCVTGVASLRNQGREGSAFPMPLLVIRLHGEHKTLHLIRMACHPTVLDERNTLYSRDLPGQIQDQMKKEEKALILNGACADLSTRFTRSASDPAELQRLGALLTQSVKKSRGTSFDTFGSRIRAVEKTVYLSRSASLAGSVREELLTAFQKMAAACTDSQILREYDARIAVLERAAAEAENSREIHICAVDLGMCVLLGMPFEMHHADGAALETRLEQMAKKPVYLVCYTGGYDGYLPSGAPLTVQSSYEDIASRYLPRSREQVWECAKQCIQEVSESS